MAEEWRVNLVIDGRGGTVKGSYYRDLQRNRLGDDVTVSAEKWRGLEEPAEYENAPGPGRLRRGAGAGLRGAAGAVMRGDF